MEDQKKETEIVIEDDVKVEDSGFETKGLTDGEIELARSHGLIKEEKEEKEDGDKEQPETDTEEDSKSEEDEDEEEEEIDTDPKDFESMDKVFEKDEKKFHKNFTPNQKALYFRYKDEKRKRQEIQKEYEEGKAGKELEQLKQNVSAKKLERINKLLETPENLTVDDLRAVINGEVGEDDDKPLTRSDLEIIEAERQKKLEEQTKQQESFNKRVELANQIGKSRYDNFDDIANLVNEVVNEDKTGTYQRVIGEVFINSDIDEEKIVDRVVSIAQLNPKFKDVVNKASPEDKEKVDRAIKNSKKRVSSASISSRGKRIITNEDDLTPEDAVKMTAEQYSKLKESTRRRLLMGG